MTAATLTLADFLLARLDAEEALWSMGGRLATQPTFSTFSQNMLRDVAAKRKIAHLHRADYNPDTGRDPLCMRCDSEGTGIGEAYPCDTLRALASVYADHPDWREEWR